MANTPIPNLTPATALTGNELIEIVQAGASARTTLGQAALLGAVFSTVAYATVAQTITTGGIEIYLDASGGAIAQQLPALNTMTAFNRQLIRIWKRDSSANAVTISSADGFLGFTSPLTLSSQGASTTLEINTTIGLYLVL